MKNELDTTHMKRPVYDIPDDIAAVLMDCGLWAAYKSRPPYQQNDYIGWISRAKQQKTRDKRIEVMLSELRTGHGYMGMKWRGK